MNEDKTLFLHIEKTAGTSLVRYLEKIVGKESFRYIHPTELNDDTCEEVIGKSKILAGHIKYDQVTKYMKDFYKITFLRDPIDRVLSFYHYAKEIPKTSDPITIKSKDLDIKGFFLFCKESNDRRFVNGMTFKLTENYGKNELENAKENLEKIDFIGFQESFSESLLMLSYIKGWNPPKETPFENKTKSKREEITNDVLELIKDMNTDDIKLYEYAKELYDTLKSETLKKAIKENLSLKGYEAI